MQVMYQRCAGIDVHLRFLVVCLTIIEAGERRKEILWFATQNVLAGDTYPVVFVKGNVAHPQIK